MLLCVMYLSGQAFATPQTIEVFGGVFIRVQPHLSGYLFLLFLLFYILVSFFNHRQLKNLPKHWLPSNVAELPHSPPKDEQGRNNSHDPWHPAEFTLVA